MSLKVEINKILQDSQKWIPETYFDIYKYLEWELSKFVIFMEIWSFYETYQFENLWNAKEIWEVLNIQVTQKNKKIEPSITCPYMAWFKSDSSASWRFIEKVLNEWYTTIIINQEKRDDNTVDRFVEDIISPGTQLQSIDWKIESKFIIFITIDLYKWVYNTHYSLIDINTWEVFVWEFLW